VALLLLAVCAAVGAWAIPDDQPPAARGGIAVAEPALARMDSVTSTVCLPAVTSAFDPDAWLRPGHQDLACREADVSQGDTA
jgi:hypothetical protein